jgi:hypothetical protein
MPGAAAEQARRVPCKGGGCLKTHHTPQSRGPAMAQLEVKVKDGKFEPSSQNGANSDTVHFHNKRSTSVTITLATPFFSKSSITLAPEGQSGDTGSATVNGTSGTGSFEAPEKKSPSPKQGEGDIKGDIIVNPNK